MKIYQAFPIMMMLFTMKVFAQEGKALEKVMTLKLLSQEGKNGAGVAWHPGERKYYTAMNGTAVYPITVFNEKGDPLAEAKLEIANEARSLWYNAATRTLQSHGCVSCGWWEYKLDKQGIPREIKTLFSGQHQPNDFCRGTFNAAANVIYFLQNDEDLQIDAYSMKTGGQVPEMQLALQSPVIKDGRDADLQMVYNNTAVYTGISNAEIGLLNIETGRIEFYDLQGRLSGYRMLPDGTFTETAGNFAYANGIFWIFNKDDREWQGFR